MEDDPRPPQRHPIDVSVLAALPTASPRTRRHPGSGSEPR